eukprot:5234290-Amphidinium_carterae.1
MAAKSVALLPSISQVMGCGSTRMLMFGETRRTAENFFAILLKTLILTALALSPFTVLGPQFLQGHHLGSRNGTPAHPKRAPRLY